jgi:RimJ/RimL family protein N-acetyltransferase
MGNILFKPLTKEYLEWARLLHNDPDVLCMLTDSHKVSEKKQLLWFDSLKKSTTSERWVVIKDNKPIGIIRVDQKDYDSKSICIGLDIHKDFRGLGLSKEVYRKLLKELFDDDWNRVWLLVAEYNVKALNLYKKLGFVQEGVQRKRLLKNGVFYDYIMMSILRSEYDTTI